MPGRGRCGLGRGAPGRWPDPAIVRPDRGRRHPGGAQDPRGAHPVVQRIVHHLEPDPGQDTMDEESEQNSSTDQDSKEEEKKEKNSESNSSEHDGKYFVIPKGKAMCDKETQFPGFKVTSHQKNYWNDENGEPDYLAVTEDDVMFNPPSVPFGSCSVKNGNPCAFAPSGKWTKTYDKVKVMGKCCVTELSELMCSTGGKITVLKHGQESELGKSNVNNADSKEQHVYNPIVDFEEFKEEINDNNEDAW